MEILLLCLMGAALTWGIVEAVRGDDDDSPPEEPPLDNAGDDLLTAESGSLLDAGDGDDTITGGSEDELLGNATIQGGAGDDLTEILADHSEIHGGPGDDTITGYASDSLVRGGLGDDTLDLDVNHSTINGGLGDDTITVLGNNSEVHGDGGDDIIDATGLTDGTIYGGTGDDVLIVAQHLLDEGNTAAYGGDGNDTLRASVRHLGDGAVNALHGGAGEDVFEVTFRADGNVPEDISGLPAPVKTVLSIRDFTPGEDVLQLDVDWQPPFDQPDLRPTVTLEQRQSGTFVTIGYPGVYQGGDEPEEMQMQSRIWLAGVSGLTLDDLQINLDPYAGDDSLAIGEVENGHINVGPGDDRVELHSSRNTLIEGYTGNDTLIAHDSDGDTLRGGAGDDVLQLTPAPDATAPSQLLGSRGDDILQVTLDSQSRAEGAPDIAPHLTGGEGADTFEIDLQPRAASGGEALPSVHITDFDPEQDRLVIDPHDRAEAGLTWQSVELRADAEGGFTDVVLTYAGPGDVDGPGIQQEIIRVAGPAPLPLSAVTIAPAAAA